MGKGGKRTGNRLGIGVRGGGTLSSVPAIRPPLPRVSPQSAPQHSGQSASQRGSSASSSVSVYPNQRRGSQAAALRAAASEESLQHAVDELMRDRYAANSNRARESWLRTWMTMFAAAYSTAQHPPPPFPLTPQIIFRVAALFKAGRYLSFEQYMQRAKSEHLALALAGTSAWSAELAAAYKDAVRSVNRGVGIARQSKPLDTLAVAGLRLPDARPVRKEWPPYM